MKNRNPFSLYDFLGYFFPGVMLLLFIVVYCFIKNKEVDIQELESAISFLNLNSSYTNGLLFFLLIIISYIIGHLISYLSSITIEKYSIWMYGYPSQYLFSESNQKYFNLYTNDEMRFWFSDKSKGKFLEQSYKKIKKRLYSSKLKPIKFFSKFRCRAFFWRISLLLILVPVTVLDLILGKLLGLKNYYAKKFDNEISKLILEKLDEFNSKKNINTYNFDFQRILNHYYFEKFEHHAYRMEYYVTLFGFLRSLSLIFNIAAIIYFFNDIYISLTLGIFSYMFYMGFMKFYRRFTIENFMCLIVEEDLFIKK